MSLHLLASSSSSCFFVFLFLLKSLYLFLDVSSMIGCNCQWMMAFSLYSLFETIDAFFLYFQILSSIFCIFQDAYRCKVLCCFWFEFCLPRFVFGLSNMYYQEYYLLSDIGFGLSFSIDFDMLWFELFFTMVSWIIYGFFLLNYEVPHVLHQCKSTVFGLFIYTYSIIP